MNILNNYNLALQWVKKYSIKKKGIVISSNNHSPYPEVTGYLIPTLIEAGEFNLAYQFSSYLKDIQKGNGSFSGPDGREYVFDTAQVLRGLLKASLRWPKFKGAANKAAKYLASSIERSGRLPSIYNSDIPEYIHVYALPPLLQAGKIFNNKIYTSSALKSLCYYKRQQNILEFESISHFYAYIIDGFLEMGEKKFVQKAIEKIFYLQKRNGAIPSFPNKWWSCSVGTAQIALIGYKTGFLRESDAAVNWLSKVQNKSGGFYGSYGFGAKYFPNEEISWANKFYLDAVHEKNTAYFNLNYDPRYIDKIDKKDPRLKIIINTIGKQDSIKVLDAGCGNGRYDIILKKLYPKLTIHGNDISQKLLKIAPNFIKKTKSNILNLNYKNNYFDLIFIIEVLEHSLSPNNAIKELYRVLKPKGKLIIIDKNVEHLGELKITDLEQWFDKQKLKNIMLKTGFKVKTPAMENFHWKKNVFIAWIGEK